MTENFASGHSKSLKNVLEILIALSLSLSLSLPLSLFPHFLVLSQKSLADLRDHSQMTSCKEVGGVRHIVTQGHKA